MAVGAASATEADDEAQARARADAREARHLRWLLASGLALVLVGNALMDTGSRAPARVVAGLGLLVAIAATAAQAIVSGRRGPRILALVAMAGPVLEHALVTLAESGLGPPSMARVVLVAIGWFLGRALPLVAAIAVARPGRRGLVLAAVALALSLPGPLGLVVPWSLETPWGVVQGYVFGLALRYAVIALGLAAALLPVRAAPPLRAPTPAGWPLVERGALVLATGQALLIGGFGLGLVPVLAADVDAWLRYAVAIAAALLLAFGFGVGGIGALGLAAFPLRGARGAFAAAGALGLVVSAELGIACLDALRVLLASAGQPLEGEVVDLVAVGKSLGLIGLLAALGAAHRAALRPAALALLAASVAELALTVAQVARPAAVIAAGHALIAVLTWTMATRLRRIADADGLVTSFADAAPPGAPPDRT